MANPTYNDDVLPLSFLLGPTNEQDDLRWANDWPQQAYHQHISDAQSMAFVYDNSLQLNLPLDDVFDDSQWSFDAGASTATLHPSHGETAPHFSTPPTQASTSNAWPSFPLQHPAAFTGGYDRYGAYVPSELNGHYPPPANSIPPAQFITGPAINNAPSFGPRTSPVISHHSDDTLVNSPAGTPPSADSPFPNSPETAVSDFDGSRSPGARFQRSTSAPSAPTSSRQDFEAALDLPMRAAGPFIPQRMYAPTTRADRQRYVEEVSPEKSIYFWNKDGESCGIPLTQAFARAVHQLDEPDEYIFNGVRPSVSIRLEWPGYRSWTKQIPAKDFKKVPSPITREKLAKEVAKCVKRFIENQRPLPNDEANKRWRVGGANGIKFEDLILVSMHHVSRGSWQPQLRLRSPRT
ncbi:hypothetical protein GGF50DRAFT_120135 [Schizophyllum commune]